MRSESRIGLEGRLESSAQEGGRERKLELESPSWNYAEHPKHWWKSVSPCHLPGDKMIMSTKPDPLSFTLSQNQCPMDGHGNFLKWRARGHTTRATHSNRNTKYLYRYFKGNYKWNIRGGYHQMHISKLVLFLETTEQTDTWHFTACNYVIVFLVCLVLLAFPKFQGMW